MARPRKNELATKDFARAVARLARKRPSSARSIERWAYAEHRLELSDVTIQKALSGQMDPTACAIEVLVVLAAFYDVEPKALGSYAGERLIAHLSLARSIHGPDDGGSTEAFPQSSCTRWAQVLSFPAAPVDASGAAARVPA